MKKVNLLNVNGMETVTVKNDKNIMDVSNVLFHEDTWNITIGDQEQGIFFELECEMKKENINDINSLIKEFGFTLEI